MLLRRGTGGLTMIKRYHNKAARKIYKMLFNKLRGYTGDSRHRRAKAVAMALLLDNAEIVETKEREAL
jgi:hypothetical protein